VADRDLLGQVEHTGVDTVGDALDHEAVDVINVCKPLCTLLVRFDVVDRVLIELCNLLSLSSNVFEATGDSSIVKLLNIIRWVGLHLPLIEGNLPLLHHLAHLLDVALHLLDELVNFSDGVHGILDELVDVVRVPLEFIHTWL
jgi:hypothetical protein